MKDADGTNRPINDFFMNSLSFLSENEFRRNGIHLSGNLEADETQQSSDEAI